MFLIALENARVHSASPRIALAVSCLVAAMIVAEFAGYWLHRLLHSHRITWLSRSHLIHHFETYPPNGALRSRDYADATEGRFSLGNIGLEWIVPSALILLVCFLVVHALGLPAWSQVLFLSALLIWPLFMFSYLHDRMHLLEFWMADTPILKYWFRKARRLHDIHHRSIADDGRMDANFGIGFFFFDRVFQTIEKRHHRLNPRGLAAARERLRADGIAAEEAARTQNSAAQHRKFS